jgi:uncharacterized protein (DUF1501 family)
MDRRKFINNSIKACASTIMLDGLIHSSLFGQSALVQAIAASCTDNILVLVQLAGGNDGLNTIIPLDQYSLLATPRKDILIPETSVLKSARLTATAFHPSMVGLRDLYDSNKLNIVQGCSYDHPDFSHFRATDIWMTGSNSNEFLNTGWIGRELEQLYPGYPTGFPSATNPDPLALQIGSTASLTFSGTLTSTAVAVSSISTDYALLGGFGDAAPDTRAGHELTFLRGVAVDTDAYNARIVAAGKAQATNLSTPTSLTTGYLANDSLSEDLKKVARLIKGGLKTRVYMVSLSGFDTHANQVDSSPTTGAHATLLNRVSKAITGFQDDLEKMGVNQRVTGMVFSEFGRRVTANGSKGTDHGSAMPVILFGSELKGDMYGTNPDLTGTNGKAVADNVPMQFDYRSVYYSVLKDWFCLSTAQLSAVFGGVNYTYLDLFKNPALSVEDKYISDRTNKLLDIYPNPMEDASMIPFNTSGGDVKIELYDMQGTSLQVVVDKSVSAGAHEVKLERNNLPSGIYLVKMRNRNFQESKKVVLK